MASTALRKRLYTLLAVANRDLAESRPGWSDEDYRLILRQCGAQDVKGTPSATTMTEQQMKTALARFKALGFTVRSNKPAGSWRAPRIAKITALWNALADAGVVKYRDQRAMEGFLRRQVRGLNHLQWGTTEQLNQCVEILKQWAKRTGVKLDD
jgi:hypothetical protein